MRRRAGTPSRRPQRGSPTTAGPAVAQRGALRAPLAAVRCRALAADRIEEEGGQVRISMGQRWCGVIRICCSGRLGRSRCPLPRALQLIFWRWPPRAWRVRGVDRRRRRPTPRTAVAGPVSMVLANSAAPGGRRPNDRVQLRASSPVCCNVLLGPRGDLSAAAGRGARSARRREQGAFLLDPRRRALATRSAQRSRRIRGSKPSRPRGSAAAGCGAADEQRRTCALPR